MKREIIKIDEELCNGCGLCIPNCHEGALQIIDGKARLISDLMCDGLGACIGHCPQDAITIETREAGEYDEILVIKDMISKGKNTIIAHLKHLKDNQLNDYVKQGIQYLEEHKSELNFDLNEVKMEVHGKPTLQVDKHAEQGSACGCPGSAPKSFTVENNSGMGSMQSQLRQWPVQMHLINPAASYFKNSDLLVAADCVAFSLGSFHQNYLKDKSLVIACPKLDSGTDSYIEKLTRLIDEAKVNTIGVMIMEVPCCGGLLQMVQTAVSKASRKVPVKLTLVGIQGDILKEEWV